MEAWLLPLCPRRSPGLCLLVTAVPGGPPRALEPGWVAIHGREHGEGSLLGMEGRLSGALRGPDSAERY